MLALKRESIKLSGQRKQRYRQDRKDKLNLITDPYVKRIATKLNTIRNDTEYVSISDAISGPININDFTKIGDAQAIPFSGQEELYMRWMQDIEQPDSLVDVRKAIEHVFPICIHYNVK